SFYRTQAMSSFLFSSYLLHFNCKFVLAKMAREFDPRLAEHYRRNAKRLINGEPVRMKWQPLKKKRRFWSF
ncbi:hypothetical protein LKM48_09365, partial [Limosilactobacillus fermentum]|nr:hypothetical protein [Limosilactobacillus fermentum]